MTFWILALLSIARLIYSAIQFSLLFWTDFCWVYFGILGLTGFMLLVLLIFRVHFNALEQKVALGRKHPEIIQEANKTYFD